MKRLKLLLLIALALHISACDNRETPEQSAKPETAETAPSTQGSAPFQANLASMAEFTFRQTTELLHLGHQLHIAINNLLQTPESDSLTKAQNALQHLQNQWTLSLPYTTMTGLTSTGAPMMNRIEKLPMLPGYLDQLPEYPFSGLVHDIMIPVDENQLLLMHSLENDEQVVFGLSALDFMLFDHFEESHFQKFVPQRELSKEEQEQEITVEQLPNNRRRALLSLQANQLVKDLSELHTRWQAGNGEDATRLSRLNGKNLNLTIRRSLKDSTTLILDALNSIQEKPTLLGRAQFSRQEKALLLTGVNSLKQYHGSLESIWEEYDQSEKDEFNAVLESLVELVEQYQETPNNTLLLELASNRCNQLLEITNDLQFDPVDSEKKAH